MSLTDRRNTLKLALGAAVLPMLAARNASAASGSGAAIIPPAGEMVYRRTLDRHLPGGVDRFVVLRDFAIRFEPFGAGGYRVTGRQQDVNVQVPSNLARLGQLERERLEDGIFPLLLDQQGHIIEGNETPPAGQVVRALDDVRRRFSDNGEEVSVLLEALHSAGAQMTAILPQDLFAPVEEQRDQRREIELPWGETGEVLTHFEASRDPSTQLMRSAERTVVTRLAGEERRSSESWELFSA